MRRYFCSILAVIAIASISYADVAAPTLKSVVRNGGQTFKAGDSFMLQYTYATGTNKVILLEFGYLDSNGVLRRTFDTAPFPSNYVWTTIGNSWPNGNYTFSYITLQDLGGISTTYNRNGTITITNGTAIAPTTHALDLSSLDFQVTGGVPNTPATLTQLTRIGRSSPSPLTANPDLVTSSTLDITYNFVAGTDPITSITLSFIDSAGYYHYVSTPNSGFPTSNGVVSTAPPRQWMNGAYILDQFELDDSKGHRISYYRDGRLSITTGTQTTTSTHNVNFSEADFTLVGGTNANTEPRPITITRKSADTTAPGASVIFNYRLLQQTTTAAQIDVVVKDSQSGLQHFVIKGNLAETGAVSGTIATDSPAGPAKVQYIEIEDMNARYIRYNRDGTVTGLIDTASGSNTHQLDFSLLDFYITRAPLITTPLQSVTVSSGSSASFSIGVAGVSPFTYQWLKNGLPITNAVSATLNLTNIQPTDAGTFSVVVTNASGTVTSPAATLTVTSVTGYPVVTTQPAGQVSPIGTDIVFTVAATGTLPINYQWLKDGIVIQGATGSTHSIFTAQPSDAGSYSCSISNAAGTAISSPATLTLTGPTAWLTNVSVRTTLSAGQGPLIVGLTVAGGAKSILIRGGGPVLANFGLTDALPDPRLEVFPSGSSTPTYSNDNWDSSLAATFSSVGAFAFSTGSKDSALLPNLDGGFTVQAPATAAGTIIVEGYDTKPKINAPRLTNLSARNQVGTGDNILIAGFAINGTGTKRLLIRGVGPRLADFGVTRPLVDPAIQVYSATQTLIAENNDWDASLTSVFASVGAFSLNPGSKDAALITTLGPGTYTVQVRGADGSIGEAIVEIYELP